MNVENFFKKQLALWPSAASRYEALSRTRLKKLNIDGFEITVQFNPDRIVSSGAKVDKASIAARPCFLCENARPPEQISLPLGDYELLVNPFPIAPLHFTIPAISHRPQLISDDINGMISLASNLDDLVIFYNGPRCGASAPDHFHFQAVPKSFLPITDAFEKNRRLPFAIKALKGNDLQKEFKVLLETLPKTKDDPEPKMNLLAWKSENGEIILAIIPRKAHRPSYYGQDKGQMVISPASIDLGGVIVASRFEDFENIEEHHIRQLFEEVCFTNTNFF